MSATKWEPDQPWVRQPFDTELSFALFGDFLALPLPRRLSDLNRPGCPLTYQQIGAFARECFWSSRAAFWDEHLAHIRTSTIERVTEETAEEVARRQLSLTRLMQSVASRELGKLQKIGEENDFPGVVMPKDAIRLATLGIRFERLILGEATERTEAGPDVTGLSLEELREVRRLQAKAGIR